MPAAAKKTPIELANAMGEHLRSKTVNGFIDLKQLEGLTAMQLALGLASLANRQDRIIRSLEDRIRILERDQRHKK